MTRSGASARRQPEIPDKLYFRIGEVSRLVGVKPYVLRFWESEFPALAPKKSDAGQRFYRRKDVELLLEIKQLLYEKRFTIEGARRHLETRPARAARAAGIAQGHLFGVAPATVEELRRELASILELLK